MLFIIIYSLFAIVFSLELKCAKLTTDAPIVLCSYDEFSHVNETFAGSCQIESNDMYSFELEFHQIKEMFDILLRKKKHRSCIDKDALGCPCGWNYFYQTKSCYKFVNQKMTTFSKAVAECASRNSELTSITSNEEQLFVNGLTGSENIWIGLLKVVNDRWLWLDQATYGNYANWFGGPPDNSKQEGNCVELKKDQKWHRKECDDTSPAFVCKQSRDESFIISLMKIRESGQTQLKAETQSVFCKYGWKYLPETHACYKGFTTQGVSFADASASCVKKNSKMASIHSDKENDFIAGLVTAGTQNGAYDKTWIGLVKIEKDWVWSDGTPLDYINWWPNQPDNSANNENCAQLRIWDPSSLKQKWNDMKCDAPLEKYICKYSL